MKEDVLKDLSDRLRVRTMMRDVRVFRPDAGLDTAGKYVMQLQSRGNPYMLFLTKIGYVESTLYVDRKVKQGHALPRIIVDHVMFDEDLYDGTVISGEMIRSNNGIWKFLADDLLAVRGQPLYKFGYRDRYAALIRIIESSYRKDDGATHTIVAKKSFPAHSEGIELLHEHIDNVTYDYNGVVYKSLVTGKPNWFVKNGTGKTQVRNNTTVLNIIPTVTPDVYEVKDADGNDRGILGVPGLDVSQELATKICGKPSAQWRCTWNKSFEKWVPVLGGNVS